ncbi:MAG: rhodanese-like domain-containing protein [Bacteroides sp.]|nr:rhodanese-like domain-containing protein [Bacteroides sp.]
MSKQSIKKIISFTVSIFIIVFMFGLFKNLFSQANESELSEALRGKVFLVDVRTPAEYASGSVEGAVNIPLDVVADSIDVFKKHSETIVVFCRSGNRSGQAKSILESNGVKNVINGGSWQNVATVKKNL